jgi:hypothetical protein
MFIPSAALLLVAHLNAASPVPQTPPAQTPQSCIKPRRSFETFAQAAARALAEVARAAVHNR